MFEIGQMVVCIDGSARIAALPWDNKLEKGRIYTLREIGCTHPYFKNTPGDCVRLEEIIRERDAPYRANRFRPIRKTDISEIVAAMNRTPITERAE